MQNLRRPIQNYDPEERQVFRSFINHISEDSETSAKEDLGEDFPYSLNHTKMPNSGLGKEPDFMEKIMGFGWGIFLNFRASFQMTSRSVAQKSK